MKEPIRVFIERKLDTDSVNRMFTKLSADHWARDEAKREALLHALTQGGSGREAAASINITVSRLSDVASSWSRKFFGNSTRPREALIQTLQFMRDHKDELQTQAPIPAASTRPKHMTKTAAFRERIRIQELRGQVGELGERLAKAMIKKYADAAQSHVDQQNEIETLRREIATTQARIKELETQSSKKPPEEVHPLVRRRERTPIPIDKARTVSEALESLESTLRTDSTFVQRLMDMLPMSEMYTWNEIIDALLTKLPNKEIVNRAFPAYMRKHQLKDKAHFLEYLKQGRHLAE